MTTPAILLLLLAALPHTTTLQEADLVRRLAPTLHFHPREAHYPIPYACLAAPHAPECTTPRQLWRHANATLYYTHDAEARAVTYVILFTRDAGYNVLGQRVGGHAVDVEFVRVHYGEPRPATFLSAHSADQGTWATGDDVYVSLGSHALYPRAGRVWRSLGVLNDVSSKRGPVWTPGDLTLVSLRDAEATHGRLLRCRFRQFADPTAALQGAPRHEGQAFWYRLLYPVSHKVLVLLGQRPPLPRRAC